MREYMTTMYYKLPGSLKQAIEKQAVKENISNSELVRRAISYYLESKAVSANADLSKAS